jgi:hypothetical protein
MSEVLDVKIRFKKLPFSQVCMEGVGLLFANSKVGPFVIIPAVHAFTVL